MGQKPVSVRAAEAGGKPYGRRAIWLCFRELSDKGPVTLLDLALKTRINRGTIRTYMESLVAGGYAEKSHFVRGEWTAYRLIRDVGIEHPRLNKKGETIVTSRESMWRSMKMLSTFTARDLALTATTSRRAVAPVDAADYCKHLLAAGYLALVSDGGKDGKGARPLRAVYMLLPGMRTGPLAPMVQRAKVVFDPNINKVMWNEEIEP
jgi:hypothetical protein